MERPELVHIDDRGGDCSNTVRMPSNRYAITALVSILVLPILGITAYLTLGVEQAIAQTQREQRGLGQIQGLLAFFESASLLARAVDCSPRDAEAIAVARARADLAFSRVDGWPATLAPAGWAGIRSSWMTARVAKTAAGRYEDLLRGFPATLVAISDGSGLTFDAETAGIDLGDALTYRFPSAVDQLQEARRRLCGLSPSPSLENRLQLQSNLALAQRSSDEGIQDISDAVSLEKGRLDLASTSQALDDLRIAVPGASLALARYIRSNGVAGEAAGRAVDSAVLSLYATMHAESPALDDLIARRLSNLRTQRILRIVPGLVIVLAAILVALLAMRVLAQRTALAVAEHEAAEQEQMALHDSLTGIMNRRAFFSTLQRAVQGGTDHGAICVFDVDHFKSINDSYGHGTGDEVLTHVAHVLEGSVRGTDVVARMGGDEFAMYLHPPIERRSVERILARIVSDVRVPFQVFERTIQTSLSAGSAFIAGKTMLDVNDAFARADAALYGVKQAERGGYAFSEEEAV